MNFGKNFELGTNRHFSFSHAEYLYHAEYAEYAEYAELWEFFLRILRETDMRILCEKIQGSA